MYIYIYIVAKGVSLQICNVHDNTLAGASSC